MIDICILNAIPGVAEMTLIQAFVILASELDNFFPSQEKEWWLITWKCCPFSAVMKPDFIDKVKSQSYKFIHYYPEN